MADGIKFTPRQWIKTLKARKKELFWLWIAYQSIKGMITLTIIWIPLWFAWKSRGG